jgi:hypothetical protein
VIQRHASSAKVQFLSALLLSSLALANLEAAEQPHDGPYVRRTQQGDWIAYQVVESDNTLHVRETPVRLGGALLIPAVGSSPSFSVKLHEPVSAVEDSVPLAKQVPLFVMADTHGEFAIATELLRRHRIIDGDLEWSFGNGQLVMLGDVFDRGPHQTELLWLLYKLESEAKAAGGALHLLLGNHETMVLSGDERYLHPKYLSSARALGVSRYAMLWGTNTLLGSWLRSKPAVIKIGRYLCAHGGISPEAVERELSISALNKAVHGALGSRVALPQPNAELASFVMGPSGPLWYRGYFAQDGDAGVSPQVGAAAVRQIREFYDVEAIFVGHTRVPTITSLFNGGVVAVQVYPHRDPRTDAPIMEALLIRDDRLFKARADGSVEPLFNNTGDQ